jgi:hypothetical protein
LLLGHAEEEIMEVEKQLLKVSSSSVLLMCC